MVANRGYSSTSASARLKLIDAAYALLDEEGFPAFTVRRIAARADLKPQLLHYYFRSMEELVLTVFELSSSNYSLLHDKALASPRPLHALWELNCNLPESRRVMEYVSLGKIYPSLREAMRINGEKFRSLQVQAIEQASKAIQLTTPPMTAAALATMISALARSMVIETNVNFDLGHSGLQQFVADILNVYEPN